MIDVQGVNNRDENAWKDLFLCYYAALCTYVESKTGSPEDSEDIVQETLLKIWQSATTFASEAHLSYYLYKAVYNSYVSFLRLSQYKMTVNESFIPDTFDDEAYTMAVREELYRELYTAINNLPFQQRKVMELSIKGKSGKEISELLGIAVNTVKVHKQKALANLRNIISKDLFMLLVLLTNC